MLRAILSGHPRSNVTGLFPEPFERPYDIATPEDFRQMAFRENLMVGGIAVLAVVVLIVLFLSLRSPEGRRNLAHLGGVLVFMTILFGLSRVTRSIGFYVFRPDGVEGALGGIAIMGALALILVPWERQDKARMLATGGLPRQPIRELLRRYLYAGAVLGTAAALTRW